MTPSGMGSPQVLSGELCVGRSQIDGAAPILDENTFWRSWVHYTPAPHHEFALNSLRSKVKYSKSSGQP